MLSLTWICTSNIWVVCTLTFQQVILSILSVPGCLLAGWAVELPNLGWQGMLVVSSGKLNNCSSYFYITQHPCEIMVSPLQL